MRKTAIALLVLITAMVFGLPQYCFSQGLSLGIKGGMNMANLSGDDVNASNSKVGFVAGGYFTLDLMVLKLQPEILYSQKGAKYETTASTTTAIYDYLEIPVLLKYSFGAIIVPSIYAGPSLGIPIYDKLEVNYPGIADTITNVKDNMSTDLGLVLGAEVKTPLKISIEARYTLGLTKIFKEVEGIQPDIKNSTISLMLGYSIF